MEHVDYTALRFFFDVLQAVVLLGVSVFVWLRTRNRVTAEAIDLLRADLRAVERQVDKRVGFGHLDEVRRELEQTNRQLSEVSASLRATTSLLNQMHEFLLQGKK